MAEATQVGNEQEQGQQEQGQQEQQEQQTNQNQEPTFALDVVWGDEEITTCLLNTSPSPRDS